MPGIDPLAATAQYELEKRIEKMDTFHINFTKQEHEPLGIVIIGMGVGADAGMEKLGIFIKIIQENSPADQTNKLKIGDMLVEIDNINLVGVTQAFATKTLHDTKTEVSFLIAREKDGQVSEIQDLIKQSLEMDRIEGERQKHLSQNLLGHGGKIPSIDEYEGGASNMLGNSQISDKNYQNTNFNQNSAGFGPDDTEDEMYDNNNSQKSDEMTDLLNSSGGRKPRSSSRKNDDTISGMASVSRRDPTSSIRSKRELNEEELFEIEQDNKLMIEMAVAEEAQKLIVLHEAELKLKNDRIKELEQKVNFEKQFSAQVKIELDRYISQLNISKKKIEELEKVNSDLSSKLKIAQKQATLAVDSAYESVSSNRANDNSYTGRVKEGMSSHWSFLSRK